VISLTTIRKKLATVLVALYALCVVAPHAAMAFSHGSMATHCLTETSAAPHDHKAVTVQAHVHDDGAVHAHGKAQPKQTKDANDQNQAACCGLFFMTALATDGNFMPLHDAPAGKVSAVPQDSLADHPPGRLHRPPII
jgi:hypothetical protein